MAPKKTKINNELPQLGWGGATAGALTGGVGGAALGPWGALGGALIGGTVGYFKEEQQIEADEEAARMESQAMLAQKNSAQPYNQASSFAPINMEQGGNLMNNDKPKRRSGQLYDYDKIGQKHSGPTGGIPIDQYGTPSITSGREPVALAEKGEIAYNSEVFSNDKRLSKSMKQKKTYADRARDIMRKYKLRLGDDFNKSDKLSRKSMDSELDLLASEQSEARAKMAPAGASALPQMEMGGALGGYAGPAIMGASALGDIAQYAFNKPIQLDSSKYMINKNIQAPVYTGEGAKRAITGDLSRSLGNIAGQSPTLSAAAQIAAGDVAATQRGRVTEQMANINQQGQFQAARLNQRAQMMNAQMRYQTDDWNAAAQDARHAYLERGIDKFATAGMMIGQMDKSKFEPGTISDETMSTIKTVPETGPEFQPPDPTVPDDYTPTPGLPYTGISGFGPGQSTGVDQGFGGGDQSDWFQAEQGSLFAPNAKPHVPTQFEIDQGIAAQNEANHPWYRKIARNEMQGNYGYQQGAMAPEDRQNISPLLSMVGIPSVGGIGAASKAPALVRGISSGYNKVRGLIGGGQKAITGGQKVITGGQKAITAGQTAIPAAKQTLQIAQQAGQAAPQSSSLLARVGQQTLPGAFQRATQGAASSLPSAWQKGLQATQAARQSGQAVAATTKGAQAGRQLSLFEQPAGALVRQGVQGLTRQTGSALATQGTRALTTQRGLQTTGNLARTGGRYGSKLNKIYQDFGGIGAMPLSPEWYGGGGVFDNGNRAQGATGGGDQIQRAPYDPYSLENRLKDPVTPSTGVTPEEAPRSIEEQRSRVRGRMPVSPIEPKTGPTPKGRATEIKDALRGKDVVDMNTLKDAIMSIESAKPGTDPYDAIGTYLPKHSSRALGKYQFMTFRDDVKDSITSIEGGQKFLDKVDAGEDITDAEVQKYFPKEAQEKVADAWFADLEKTARKQIDPTTKKKFTGKRLIERITQMHFGGKGAKIDAGYSDIHGKKTIKTYGQTASEYYTKNI